MANGKNIKLNDSELSEAIAKLKRNPKDPELRQALLNKLMKRAIILDSNKYFHPGGKVNLNMIQESGQIKTFQTVGLLLSVKPIKETQGSKKYRLWVYFPEPEIDLDLLINMLFRET